MATNQPLFNTGSSFFDGILNGGVGLFGSVLNANQKADEMKTRRIEADVQKAKIKQNLNPKKAQKSGTSLGFLSGVITAQKITIGIGLVGLAIALIGLRK